MEQCRKNTHCAGGLCAIHPVEEEVLVDGDRRSQCRFKKQGSVLVAVGESDCQQEDGHAQDCPVGNDAGDQTEGPDEKEQYEDGELSFFFFASVSVEIGDRAGNDRDQHERGNRMISDLQIVDDELGNVGRDDAGADDTGRVAVVGEYQHEEQRRQDGDDGLDGNILYILLPDQQKRNVEQQAEVLQVDGYRKEQDEFPVVILQPVVETGQNEEDVHDVVLARDAG